MALDYRKAEEGEQCMDCGDEVDTLYTCKECGRLYFTTSPSRHSVVVVAIVPASSSCGCCAITPS